MPSTQLPGIGLYKGWDNGEKGWGDQVNENFCKLDAFLAICITDQILSADLPATGNQGEQYYLTDTNEVATYQGSTWLKCAPPKGLLVYNQSTGTITASNGSSLVDPTLVIPTATLADIKAQNPELYVTSDIILPCIEEQIEDLNASIVVDVVDPTAAPDPGDLPFACNSSTGEFFFWTGAAWKKVEATPEETVTAYDVGGVGAASANKVVKTGADGCIDPSFFKHMSSYVSSSVYETSIGGPGNLVGGEQFYNSITGNVEIYDAISGQWEPVSSADIFCFDEIVNNPTGVSHQNTANLTFIRLIGCRIDKHVFFSFVTTKDYINAFDLAITNIPLSNFPTIFTSPLAGGYGSYTTNYNSITNASISGYVSWQSNLLSFATFGDNTPASVLRTERGTFIGVLS